MSLAPIFPETLYQNVVELLERGQRTATYKLATMTALIDFCASHRPQRSLGELEVPIVELAKRVMALYWRQSRPFEGIQLQQSTQAVSRILQAVDSLRSAVSSTDELALGAVAQNSPTLYQRALDEISLCLAQQPLPRLQRLPGQRSVAFLFDDSFMHDTVTRSQLQQHNNAIRLRLGVADGLAENQVRLTHLLENMWVDDVLRLNWIPAEKRTALKNHLFGSSTDIGGQTDLITPPAAESPQPAPASDGGVATPTFASRLNYLFEKVRDSYGQSYSSGEIAAKVRQAGVMMSVSTISQLRSGHGKPPTQEFISALASAFGVEPSYFNDGKLPTTPVEPRSRTASEPVAPLRTEQDQAKSDGRARAMHAAPPDRVFLDDMDDIASACAIRPNGCWLAPFEGTVRCRTRDNAGDSGQVMTMALHRWSWMVDHGLTSTPLPVDLIRIREICDGERCCNPQHLRATNVLGRSLSPRDVAMLLERLASPRGGSPNPTSPYSDRADQVPTTAPQRKNVPAPPVTPRLDSLESATAPAGLPLKDDLESIAAYCTIDRNGCWVIPKTASVPCRATGDDRPVDELPKIAPHRWAWMVVNGRAQSPLPSSLFQVWKNCGNRRCCNPDHLYLTNPDGEESSVEDAEEWLKSMESQEAAVSRSEAHEHIWDRPPSSAPVEVTPRGGRHRAPEEETRSTHDFTRIGSRPSSLAERLNELFDDYPRRDSKSLTSSEVAAALQEDGLAVSAESINRIRNGADVVPSSLVVEALAYFFNVDADYFAGLGTTADAHPGKHQVPPQRHEPDHRSSTSPRAHTSPPLTPSPTIATSHRQIIPITVVELGRIVTGLSEAVSECLARNPQDVDRAARLALAIAEAGELIRRPSDTKVISRPLLERMVRDLTAVGYVSLSREPLLPRLIAILDAG